MFMAIRLCGGLGSCVVLAGIGPGKTLPFTISSLQPRRAPKGSDKPEGETAAPSDALSVQKYFGGVRNDGGGGGGTNASH